jgi:hypothetical protein
LKSDTGNYFLFFICLIPTRKRKYKAIIRAIAIISKGAIIKNDPPELIPKMENITVYPITKTVRIIAEEIIKIPDIFDFCIDIIYYLIIFIALPSIMASVIFL